MVLKKLFDKLRLILVESIESILVYQTTNILNGISRILNGISRIQVEIILYHKMVNQPTKIYEVEKDKYIFNG